MQSLDALMLTHIITVYVHIACMTVISLTRHYKSWAHSLYCCNAFFCVHCGLCCYSVCCVVCDRRYVHLIRMPYYACLRFAATLSLGLCLDASLACLSAVICLMISNGYFMGVGFIGVKLLIEFVSEGASPYAVYLCCCVPFWILSQYTDKLVQEIGCVLTVSLQMTAVTLLSCMRMQTREQEAYDAGLVGSVS